MSVSRRGSGQQQALGENGGAWRVPSSEGTPLGLGGSKAASPGPRRRPHGDRRPADCEGVGSIRAARVSPSSVGTRARALRVRVRTMATHGSVRRRGRRARVSHPRRWTLTVSEAGTAPRTTA